MLSQMSVPYLKHHIPGTFEDDLDICEMFCRVEEYCDAWMYVMSTYISAQWSRGYCLARGPPTADIWITQTLDPSNVVSGRKSLGNC